MSLAVDEAGRLLDRQKLYLQVGLGGAEFELDVLRKTVDQLLEFLLVVEGYNNVGPSLTGDGVAKIATVDTGKPYLALLGGVPEYSIKNFDGTTTATVDIVATMATLQTRHLDAIGGFARGDRTGSIVDGDGCVDATGMN